MNPDDPNQSNPGGPTDSGGSTMPPAEPSAPAQEAPTGGVCATCGGTSANGNCVNCGQPDAACTCPPAASSGGSQPTGGMGGMPPAGGEEPPSGGAPTV